MELAMADAVKRLGLPPAATFGHEVVLVALILWNNASAQGAGDRRRCLVPRYYVTLRFSNHLREARSLFVGPWSFAAGLDA